MVRKVQLAKAHHIPQHVRTALMDIAPDPTAHVQHRQIAMLILLQEVSWRRQMRPKELVRLGVTAQEV